MARASLKQLASLRMDNKTHLLVFALIAIPGSPYLVLSGIPLLGKLEAALFCFVAIAIATQWMRTRQTIITAPVSTRSQASKTILIVLISVKLISFFAFPLQSGFEACYKSLYNPESGCEKSYNNPFFRNDDVNQIGDISRVDKHINFRSTNNNKIAKTGTNSSNWNLPFANEYPRLADLWLTRIPFEVQFAGVIGSDSNQGGANGGENQISLHRQRKHGNSPKRTQTERPVCPFSSRESCSGEDPHRTRTKRFWMGG
jgi:hypothetical protein